MQLLAILSLVLFQLVYQVFAANPCQLRQISGADGVCVCNETYCDNFPALRKPSAGNAFVYESGKSGHRFSEFTIKVESSPQTLNKSKESQTITINGSKTYQKIIGFGTSFTDVSGFVLNSMPKGLYESIMKSYFTDDGIQYNMARIPIGATDYSFRQYHYDDTSEDKNLTKFALADEDHKYKIPNIKQAQELSKGIKLFATPWNAPSWMTTNNEIKGQPGGDYYEAWAKYFVKFLDAYKAEGINFWAVDPANEPTLGKKYGGVYFDANLQRDFIKMDLGPQLQKGGYGTDKLKLMIYDDNVAQDMEAFAKSIYADAEAKKYVSGIAYHWYASSRDSEYPDTLLDQVHNEHPDQFQLMTEACHLDGMGNGRWDFGEHYAHDIIRDINHWAGGWVEWNMALGLNGCDRCNDKQFGSAIEVDITKKEALKQPTYYAIGHFSKFLVPDSVRVDHTLAKQIGKLFVLTMKRPDNGMVVVVLNENDQSVDLIINDGNNHLANTIPERSIQSYLYY